MKNKDRVLANRLFEKLYNYMGSNAELHEKFGSKDDPRSQSWRAAQHKVHELWNVYIGSGIKPKMPKRKKSDL